MTQSVPTPSKDIGKIQQGGWQRPGKELIAPLAVFVLSFVLIMIAFAESIGRYPLLDEQYLLGFLKNSLSSTSSPDFIAAATVKMINWSGPQNEDSWGILASSLAALLACLPKGLLWLDRLLAILIHTGNAVLFYFFARCALAEGEAHFLKDTVSWMAAAVSIVFATYALAPETVSYLGGLAYELGCAFILASFILYNTGKQRRTWSFLGLSWISFILALLCDSSLWSAGALPFILELTRGFIGAADHEDSEPAQTAPFKEEVFKDKLDLLLEHEQKSVDDRLTGPPAPLPGHQVVGHDEGPGVLLDSFVPSLIFVLLGALIPIGALPAANTEKLPAHFIASASDWLPVLKHLFFPVNEAILKGYGGHYRWLYVLFAIPSVVAVIALIRNRRYRQNFVFLSMWLLVVTVPHLHHMLTDAALSGSRFAYNAILPVAGLITLLFFAPAFAFHGHHQKQETWQAPLWMKAAFTLIPLVLSLMVVIGNVARSHAQNHAYKTASGWLRTIQTNARNVALKEKSPLVLIGKMPASAAVVQRVSPYNLIALDGENQMARAYKVPGGRLKDSLRQGRYRDITVRWQEEFNSLIPAVVSIPPEVPREQKIDAHALISKLRPGLYFLKGAQYDEKAGTLVFNSNGANGPLVNFEYYGVDTTGDDFFYVDARIETPLVDPDAHMELHWLTNLEQEHKQQQFTDRRTLCRVVVNDGQFHRYYFPLRSTGWFSNGQIISLTLGFPASSKAEIKEVGTNSPSNRLPHLTLATNNSPPRQPFYAQQCFDYPNAPELGLATIDGKAGARFDYDASMVDGCDHAIMEISLPGQFFNNPNGDELSSKTLKKVFLDKARGSYNLIPFQLKMYDGIYSIRVFGVDRQGKVLANASDEFNCLVYSDAKDTN